MKKRRMGIVVMILILVVCNLINIKAQINVKDYENSCMKIRLRVPHKIINSDSMYKEIFYLDLENCGKKTVNVYSFLKTTNPKLNGTSGFYFEIYELSDKYGMLHYPYDYNEALAGRNEYIGLYPKKSYSYPVFFFQEYILSQGKQYRLSACLRIERPDGSYYLLKSDYVDIELR